MNELFSQLAPLDWAILIIVLLGLWGGFKSGLIKSIVSLVGWFIAIILGSRFASVVAPFLTAVIDSQILQLALAFLLVVLVALAVINLVAMVLNKALSTLRLGFLDKLAGGALGALRNLLVVLVLLNVLTPVLKDSVVLQNSVLAPELMPYAPMAETITKQIFGEAWEQLSQSH